MNFNFPDGRTEITTKTYINQHYIDSIERLAHKYNVELDRPETITDNSSFPKGGQTWFKKLFGN